MSEFTIFPPLVLAVHLTYATNECIGWAVSAISIASSGILEDLSQTGES